MESTIKSFAPTRRFPTMSSWPKCILKYGYGWVNLATKKLQSSSYGPKRGKVIFEVRPYWQSSLFIATYSSSHFDRSWEVKRRCNSIVFRRKMKIHAISASDDDSRHNLIKSKGPLNIQVLWEAPIVPPFFHVREASLCAKCACCLLKAMTFGGSSFEVSSFVLGRNAAAVGRAWDDLFLVSFIAKKLDRIWKRFISKNKYNKGASFAFLVLLQSYN